MFLNAPPTSPYDCYVIGSGPAGITLSLELAERGKTVLLFETGTDDPRRDMPNAVGYGPLGVEHWNQHSVRALGGTSRVWHGRCLTLMARDFDTWPINKVDLLPHYQRAAEILEIDASVMDAESPWCPGFTWKPFTREPPVRFAVKYHDALASSPVVHVALASSVTGFDANAARSLVETLTYYHHPSRSMRRLSVGHGQIVVAGGGLGNAQLLLQPREDGAVPVGNESGQVGRFLMEHPSFSGCAEIVIDEEHDADDLVLIPDDDHARRHNLIGCTVSFARPSTDHWMTEYLSSLASETGREKTAFWRYRGNIMAEMRPRPTNRVFLTGERNIAGFYRPAVQCIYDAEAYSNVEATLRLLGEALIATGKGRLRFRNDRLYQAPLGGGHIMGTTRMGDNPSTSVVDGDCRLHGYHNLSVAGSSVFTTGGYANPTLTIVALAVRLATRIGNLQ